MKIPVAACLITFCCSLSAQSNPPNTIYVASGDFEGLADAITQANAQSKEFVSRISLENGEYTARGDANLPPITGRMEIRGGSRDQLAVINAAPDWDPNSLLVVEEGAELTLKLIEFKEINISSDPPAFIINRGALTLETVSFSSVKSQNWCLSKAVCDTGGPIILNEIDSSLELEYVSFVNSGNEHTWTVSDSGIINNHGSASLWRIQIYLDSSFESNFPLRNWGTMDITYSSFRYFDPLPRYQKSLIDSQEGATTSISNSIVEGFEGNWCGSVSSLGYNINDFSGCDWSYAGDLIGIDPGIIWRPPFHTLNFPIDRALMPTPASPAADSGECGYPCERGAFRPAPSLLASGGINGLYYNPEADGHYIQIQQTDYLTLVIWNTFDQEGNHVWVYGTGQLTDNNSLRAETYINRNVSLVPGVTDPEAEYWGIIDIEMQSCLDGYLAYDSELPGFGHGEFPVKRLGFIKQLGCTDVFGD
jgi:hypothetical protein